MGTLMVFAKYLCFLGILFFFPLQVEAKKLVYDLKGAIEHALKANPSIESKLLAVDRAKMEVGVATSYFYPTVSLFTTRGKLHNSGGWGTTEDFSNTSQGSGMRVNLNVFSGFSHLNNLQKTMLNVDVEKARHSLARLELIGNIQLQFLQLLRSREDMKTVQDSKKRISTQLEAARAFVKVGMAPYLNVLQNEVELSTINQQEIRVANNIRNAEVMLNRYLGYSAETPVTYIGDLKRFSGVMSYTEEEAIKVSLYSRPDLIIAQKSVAVAIKQAHADAGRFLPTVNFSYDSQRYAKEYTVRRSGLNDYDRNYWNLGLNVNWEIFSGGGTTFTVLGDKKNVDSLRKAYEDAMNGARAEVIKALLDIAAAKELIATSRKGVEAATESYGMANKRYTTNTGTITELLDAQMRLTEAEANYTSALAEYQAAKSRFFYSIGKENPGLD